MKNFAAYALGLRRRDNPQKIAAVSGESSITYADLYRVSAGTGGYLRKLGLSAGDRVLIVLPDSFSFMAAFLGAIMAGMVVAPLGDRLGPDDYASAVAAIKPALLICPPGHGAIDSAVASGLSYLCVNDDILADIAAGGAESFEPHPAQGDEVCILFTTSGTTGHPKTIPHSHNDFFHVGQHFGIDFLGYEKDDIVLATAKMHHIYGLFATLILPLLVGATSILDPGRPNPVNTLRLLIREKVTILALVPAMYAQLLLTMGASDVLMHPRICFSTGEALPEATYHAWREKTGHEIAQGYGATETMTPVIGNLPGSIVPGTVGRLIPPYQAVIVDAEHRLVASGTPGEIAVKGPSVMTGYLGAKEWSDKTFTGDGMLLTGDMGLERDGIFTILGRKDDLFKAGGVWVTPSRVENALQSHPGVAQCAVTGGVAGVFTLVRAHVVLAPGYAPSPRLIRELRQHAGQQLPEYMVPSDFDFLGSLPMTASGKVQRFKLKRA